MHVSIFISPTTGLEAPLRLTWKEAGRGDDCILAYQQTVTLPPLLRPAQAGVAVVALWCCQDLWVRQFSCGGSGLGTSTVRTVTAGDLPVSISR